MAQPVTNPKIEELRGRLKSDPKSRLFYPLAEELRKVSQFSEAEQVLRTGLTYHPTYLSAWVSLGRVLRDTSNNTAAVEALTKALQIDPGNVVAARFLADAYLALGDKVEAIKKYKLVHALLPSDEELEGTIERLERELHPPAPAPLSEMPPEDLLPPETPAEEMPFGGTSAADEMPWSSEPAEPPAIDAPQLFVQATEQVAEEQSFAEMTGDAEPMFAAHAESPFEEPLAYGANAFDVEQPAAMHLEPAPESAEAPADLAPPEPEVVSAYESQELFAPAPNMFGAQEDERVEVGIASESPFPLTTELQAPAADDFTKTITMADLYAKQGLVDEARDIYEDILARDPNNDSVRAKLDALSSQPAGDATPIDDQMLSDEESMPEAEPAAAPPVSMALTEGKNPRVARLEHWLAKVTRRDSGRV